MRALISIHKRDKSLIVYGGALDLFIDNVKHLFILNQKALPEYRHVWLTRSNIVLKRIKEMGFEAIMSNTREGQRLLYRAGMVIYDNRIDEFANHELSEGAVRLELWHGVTCVKMIGSIHTDSPEPYVISSKFKEKFIQNHIYGDYVLATSHKLRNTMSAAFQIPVEKTIVADQPRNHVLYMNSQELDSFVEKFEDFDGKKLYNELKSETRQKVIYMPTFRDANPNYIFEAIPDWNEFNCFLRENDIVFYLKVHRITPLPTNLNYSNIRVIDNGLDIYPILPLFDRLVTDYSSIMFDYSLIEKPIIIYDFDLDEYAHKSRNVFVSFYNLLEGLSEAKTYRDLKRLLLVSDSDIKVLPFSDYYDCPGDRKAIYDFICKVMNN